MLATGTTHEIVHFRLISIQKLNGLIGMCCEIMAIAERPIVELLHADVGHNIQLATKEREKQRREQHNRQDKTGGKHEATPKHVIPHFHEQRATGLIPTKIRLVNDPLHGLE